MSDPLDPTLNSGDPADRTETDGDEAYCAACNQSFTVDAIFCPNDGAKLVKLKARPDMLLGRVFDSRYEIRTALGHGGMGTVYRGWQLSVDREVAIKVIHPKLATDRVVAKRFLREARLSSRLSQPNIINVYDFGQTDDGILYLVMELLHGHTLGKELESQRPLPLRRIVSMLGQICDALEAAHGQGIVHRDLKPGNIVILDDPPGRDLIKILDFGLAKSLVSDTTSLVTHTGALLGTPLYMPPEQILGKPSDQRADLYSLGCMLYQMVSGRPPFIGENINVVLAAHVRDPAPPLHADVPAALVALIEHLMRKAPDERIANARKVHEAITALEDTASAFDARPSVDLSAARQFALAVPISQSPVSVPPEHTRHRAWRVILPLVALAAVAAIVVAVMASRSGPGGATTGGGRADAMAIALDAEQAPDVVLDAGASAIDARAAIDARSDARTPVDARIVHDARILAFPDARVRAVDARGPIEIDAGVRPSPLDAAPRSIDARLVDAKPDLPLFGVDSR